MLKRRVEQEGLKERTRVSDRARGNEETTKKSHAIDSKIGIQIYFPSTLKRPIVHATGKYFFNCVSIMMAFYYHAFHSLFPLFFLAWFFHVLPFDNIFCRLSLFSFYSFLSLLLFFSLPSSFCMPYFQSTILCFLLISISLDLLVMNVLSHSIWFTISSKSANLKKTLKCQWRLITGRKIAAD